MNIHTSARSYNDSASPTSSLSAIQLGSDQPIRFGVTVLALSTNTGTVYVGNSGVTTANGFPLSAGAAMDIPVDNINKVYLIGSGNIRWIGV